MLRRAGKPARLLLATHAKGLDEPYCPSRHEQQKKTDGQGHPDRERADHFLGIAFVGHEMKQRRSQAEDDA